MDFAQKLEGRGQDTVFVAYRFVRKELHRRYASVLFCRPKQMELPRPSYTVRVENRGEAFDIYVKSNCYASSRAGDGLDRSPILQLLPSVYTAGRMCRIGKELCGAGVTVEQLRKACECAVWRIHTEN